MKKKEELYSFSQQNNGAVVETDIRMIPLSELHDFNGHPIKVENDMALNVKEVKFFNGQVLC